MCIRGIFAEMEKVEKQQYLPWTIKFPFSAHTNHCDTFSQEINHFKLSINQPQLSTEAKQNRESFSSGRPLFLVDEVQRNLASIAEVLTLLIDELTVSSLN